MKNLSELFLIIIFAVSLSQVYAQQRGPNISFDKKEHDFGKILEEKGKVTCKFGFTNTGSEPLIIQNVKPSCGCTAPEWSRKPVLPGARGFVSATYDPKGRPGKFKKSIQVMTNTENSNYTIWISGEVIQGEKNFAKLYPHEINDLRLKTSHVAFGTILKGQTKKHVLKVVNISDQPLKISFKDLPEHITAKPMPEILKPQQEGVIAFSYNSGLKEGWDYLHDRLTIYLNDAPGQRQLAVSAVIKEDFSLLTPEQIANGPVIKFESTVYDFGTVTAGEKVNHDFSFTNEGKSDLIIRKVQATCGCTAVKPVENVIKPGESSMIKAVFNSRGRKGNQSKSIIVITNDPKNSRISLSIKGVINSANN